VRSTRFDHSGPAIVRAIVCAAITTVTAAGLRPRSSCSQTGKNCMYTPSTANEAA